MQNNGNQKSEKNKAKQKKETNKKQSKNCLYVNSLRIPKGIIKSHKSKDRQYNGKEKGQNDNQRSAKHYTEN